MSNDESSSMNTSNSRKRYPLETTTSRNSDDDDYDDESYGSSSDDSTRPRRGLLSISRSNSNAAAAITYHNMIVQGILRNNAALPKAVLVLAIIILVIFYGQNNTESIFGTHYTSRTNVAYCIDPEDPVAWKNEFVRTTNRTRCTCYDPTIATPRIQDKRSNRRAWNKLHKKEVADIKDAIRRNVSLDFIMIGDSITERWNGTGWIGRISNPEYRVIYEKYFDKSKLRQQKLRNPINFPYTDDIINNALQGMALGISGDISTELLWRLQNGIISHDPKKRIYPKGFIVLIGTNDIGRMHCSKRTVLSGILQVVNYIHSTYGPSMPIIVHALLPRNDYYKPDRQDYQLGRMYTMIEFINTELEKICQMHSNWHYFNINTIFLRPKSIPPNTNPQLTTNNYTNEIIPELMDDALHPSVQGCDIWGPLLVDAVNKYFVKKE